MRIAAAPFTCYIKECGCPDARGVFQDEWCDVNSSESIVQDSSPDAWCSQTADNCALCNGVACLDQESDAWIIKLWMPASWSPFTTLLTGLMVLLLAVNIYVMCVNRSRTRKSAYRKVQFADSEYVTDAEDKPINDNACA